MKKTTKNDFQLLPLFVRYSGHYHNIAGVSTFVLVVLKSSSCYVHCGGGGVYYSKKSAQ